MNDRSVGARAERTMRSALKCSTVKSEMKRNACCLTEPGKANKRSSPLEARRQGRARIYTYGQRDGYFQIPGHQKTRNYVSRCHHVPPMKRCRAKLDLGLSGS
jgi:hypothetical protein